MTDTQASGSSNNSIPIMFRLITLAVSALLIGGSFAFAPSSLSNSVVSTRQLSPRSQQVFVTPIVAPFYHATPRVGVSSALNMSENEQSKSSLPVFLDPGTKGKLVTVSVSIGVYDCCT